VSFCILEMLFKNNFNVLKVLDIKWEDKNRAHL
jgi:hypothetical protein